jgi:hypothetical protein
MTRKSKKDTSIIKVDVAKVSEEVITLALEEGATVSEALDRAGYSGHSARVNGESVELDDLLEDGDELWVGSNVKNG